MIWIAFIISTIAAVFFAQLSCVIYVFYIRARYRLWLAENPVRNVSEVSIIRKAETGFKKYLAEKNRVEFMGRLDELERKIRAYADKYGPIAVDEPAGRGRDIIDDGLIDY